MGYVGIEEDYYISVKSVLDITAETGALTTQSRIRELTPADVAPVRHGKWLPIVSYNNTYKCSECGRLLVNITDGLNMVTKHYPYCHCGAKMDGERKE